MNRELFPNLPVQRRPERIFLDLNELDQELSEITQGNFSFSLNKLSRVPIITVVGKGITARFELNTEDGQILLLDHTDVMDENDGTPTDVAPHVLDTAKILAVMQQELEKTVKNLLDPLLVE